MMKSVPVIENWNCRSSLGMQRGGLGAANSISLALAALASIGCCRPSLVKRASLITLAAGVLPSSVTGQADLPTGWTAGEEFKVSTFVPGIQSWPRAVSLANGGYAVVWSGREQDSDGSDGVFGQILDAHGRRLGPEFSLNANALDQQEYPRVAPLASGFVATWHSLGQLNETGWGIFGQRFDEYGNQIGDRFHVNAFTTYIQAFSQIARLPNGFVVVWQSWSQDPDGSMGVYGQIFDRDAHKIGSEFRVNNFTMDQQGSPSIATSPNGFAVFWHSEGQQVPDEKSIHGQFFAANGTKLRGELAVHDASERSDGWLAAAAVPGGVLVAWNQNDTNTVRGQLYDEEMNRVGIPVTLSNHSSSPWPTFPSIAALPDGFVVTWHATGNVQMDVYAQIFDRLVNKIGPAFQVNTFTPAWQDVSSVAAQPNGFVVVWKSHVQDPDGSQGIYGRVFSYRGTTAMSANTLPTAAQSDSSIFAISTATHGSTSITEVSQVVSQTGEAEGHPFTAAVVSGIVSLIAGLAAGAGLTYFLQSRKARAVQSGDSPGAGLHSIEPRATTEVGRHYQTPLPAYDQVDWPAAGAAHGSALGALPTQRGDHESNVD